MKRQQPMLDKTYFKNTYVQNQTNLQYDNPDAIACITIDGYTNETDKNDEGEVIAEIYMTKNGDIITAWRNNAYSLIDAVKNIIEQSKDTLRKMYNDTWYVIYSGEGNTNIKKFNTYHAAYAHMLDQYNDYKFDLTDYDNEGTCRIDTDSAFIDSPEDGWQRHWLITNLKQV